MNRIRTFLAASAAFAFLAAPAFAGQSTDIVIDTGASQVFQANLAGNVGKSAELDQINANNVISIDGQGIGNVAVNMTAKKVIQGNLGVNLSFDPGSTVTLNQTNANNVVDATLKNVGTPSLTNVNLNANKVAQINVGVNLALDTGGIAKTVQTNANNVGTITVRN